MDKNELSGGSKQPPLSTKQNNSVTFTDDRGWNHYSLLPPIHSGPDGMKPCQRPNLKPTYVDHNDAKLQNFSSKILSSSKSFYVSGIGWGTNRNGFDVRLLNSGHQIKRTFFRDSCDERLKRWPFP